MKPLKSEISPSSDSSSIDLENKRKRIARSLTIDMEGCNFIYVLRLQRGKFYVGKTSNPLRRLSQHLLSSGSEWTRMFPIIDIKEFQQADSPFAEDTMVKRYMIKYGIQNVRGGSYSQAHLDESAVDFLEREFITAGDLCYKCRLHGHFANECPRPRPAANNAAPPSRTTIFQMNNTAILPQELQDRQQLVCFRCGRDSHFADRCFAKRDVNGSEIFDEDDEVCFNCGRPGHFANECYARRQVSRTNYSSKRYR